MCRNNRTVIDHKIKINEVLESTWLREGAVLPVATLPSANSVQNQKKRQGAFHPYPGRVGAGKGSLLRGSRRGGDGSPGPPSLSVLSAIFPTCLQVA